MITNVQTLVMLFDYDKFGRIIKTTDTHGNPKSTDGVIVTVTLAAGPKWLDKGEIDENNEIVRGTLGNVTSRTNLMQAISFSPVRQTCSTFLNTL